MNIFRTFGGETTASTLVGSDATLGQMNFAFIDMGQGDCTIISCPDNTVYIVDCGTVAWSSQKYFTKAQEIVRAWAGNKSIYLICTHPDRDHYNQFINLLLIEPKVKVSAIYFSRALSESSPLGRYKQSGFNINMRAFGYPKIMEINLNNTSHYMRSWMRLTGYDESLKENIPETGLVLRSGKTPKGKDWSLTIIAGNVATRASSSSATANNVVSLCTIAKLDNDKLFLTGDSTEETLSYLYDKQRAHFQNCSIFQIPHHGSESSVPSATFKDWVNPQSLYVSVGLLHDAFNLPKATILNTWLTCKRLRTEDEWTYDEWVPRVKGYYNSGDLNDVIFKKWKGYKVLNNNSRTLFWLADPEDAAPGKSGTGFYGLTYDFYFIYRRTTNKDLYLTATNGSWYDQDFFDPKNLSDNQ
jgi:beta-lactamase superfamily II metal-dependent hydrolase